MFSRTAQAYELAAGLRAYEKFLGLKEGAAELSEKSGADPFKSTAVFQDFY